MTLFLLGKLNKTNEDQVIDVNIYWKRYPLCYIMHEDNYIWLLYMVVCTMINQIMICIMIRHYFDIKIYIREHLELELKSKLKLKLSNMYANVISQIHAWYLAHLYIHLIPILHTEHGTGTNLGHHFVAIFVKAVFAKMTPLSFCDLGYWHNAYLISDYMLRLFSERCSYLL